MLQSPTQVTGVKMKLIAWAIALAAAGLTPAAAQTPQAAQPQATQQVTGPGRGDRSVRARAGAEPRCGERARAFHSGDRQSDRHSGDRDRLRACASREAYRRSDQGGHRHPGAGDGDRPRRRRLPQHLAARPLRDHQHLRSGPARLHDASVIRRGANPTPSRTSHNTALEVVWTLVPVLILVAHRDPVDAAAQQAVQPAAGRRDDQGHRQPVVLDLFLPGPRRVRDRFEHAEGKGGR